MDGTTPLPPAAGATEPDNVALVRKAADYFDAVGKDGLARSLRNGLDSVRDATTIAVLGEVGRGKTLLIEALSHAQSAAGTTGTGSTTGTAGTTGTGGTITDALANATTFVDCPGFDGADTEVTRAAIALTQNAGVLVFVLDATTTITAQELSVLEEIVQSTRSLVVAVAKKDKNLLGWRDVERENYRQIREHLGREIPVVGVSALRYLSAQQGDPFLADAVVQDSRIPELWNSIMGARERSSSLEKTPVLWQALQLLEAELPLINANISQDKKRIIEALERKQRQLDALVSDRRRGQQLLNSGLNQARSAVIAELETSLVEVREKWQKYFEKTPPRYIRAHQDAIFFQIEAEFTTIFENSIHRFMALSREAYARVNDGIVDWHAIVDALTELGFDSEVREGPGEEKYVSKLVDPSLVSLTIAGGASLTHVIGLVPGVGAAIVGSGGAALPFVAMAGLWLGVNLYDRATKTGRSELKKWFDQLIVQTRRQVSHAIETVYNELRPLVINQFNDDLEIRINLTKQQLQQLARNRKRGEGTIEDEILEAKKKALYLERLITQIRERVDGYA